jgi:hypothetical protein
MYARISYESLHDLHDRNGKMVRAAQRLKGEPIVRDTWNSMSETPGDYQTMSWAGVPERGFSMWPHRAPYPASQEDRNRKTGGDAKDGHREIGRPVDRGISHRGVMSPEEHV